MTPSVVLVSRQTQVSRGHSGQLGSHRSVGVTQVSWGHAGQSGSRRSVGGHTGQYGVTQVN